MAEEAPATPAEDTVEVAGARQQIKLRIIEGGVLFMSFVVLCLIFGLALAIERIICNMATTNTKTLMDEVEAALKSGGVDAAAADGPVAAIFQQGLERSGGGYKELAKPEDYGSLESTKLERGLRGQPLHRPGPDARLHGNGDHD